MATAASAEADPSRLCPQPCPGAPATTGASAGASFCDRPGKASNSPISAITGLPLPKLAVNAVGMPASPACTSKPVGAQFLLEQRRALVLVIPEFGRLPDLAGDGAEAVRMSGHAGQHIVGRGKPAGGQKGQKDANAIGHSV